jgi:hypothetical protein
MSYETKQQATHHDASPRRHAYHHPRTSIGATGHWITTAGMLAPLVIPEVIKDPARQWRLIRIASVATALVSQGFWAHKISKERQEARERELTCQIPG